MTVADYLSLGLALATSLVAGLVGSFALMKRMTLAGDVMSHLALPGLGLAFLWKINPLVGAAATLAIGILVIQQLQRRSGLATETSIGVVFVAALAAGTLLTPKEDLIDALFGGFSEIGWTGFSLGIAGCVLIAGTMYVLRHKLILVIFSPDLAKTLRIDVDRTELIYLATFGLTILLGLQFLGALLVGAMIIVPAATGRHLARSLDQFLVISGLASMLAVAAGFAAAREWGLPLGPTIAGATTILFALGMLKRKA